MMRIDIEYPEFLVMILREIAYGINIGFNRVLIKPAQITDFHYAIGNIDVLYSQSNVVLNLPGNGERKQLIIGGLKLNYPYLVNATNFTTKANTDQSGTLVVGNVPFFGGNYVTIVSN